MSYQKLSQLRAWQNLKEQVQVIDRPENHLKNLCQDASRHKNYRISGAGMTYDFSYQRITDQIRGYLYELANEQDLLGKFRAMMSGAKVNNTENRAALHTASRDFSKTPLIVDKIDVTKEIETIREEVKQFADRILSKELTGSTGKPFKSVVVIGIGGSHLGIEFMSFALEEYARTGIDIHYLSNVDIHNFGRIANKVDPQTTLWIIISKSFSTPEVAANATQAFEFVKSKGIDPQKHFIAVTSKPDPEKISGIPFFAKFGMNDFIGGRYSVTSAVGGIPLSLYLGPDNFEEILKGAEEMDIHARQSDISSNLPANAALISIWNNNFLGYQASAVIPYATPLKYLTAHIQQLYMESTGKSVDKNGNKLDVDTGVIIFGFEGTNAQHSFFQLAHQGRPFPIEFIGVLRPYYDQYQSLTKGVTNHQELWANMTAQAKALAQGKDDDNPMKHFSGNRPSSTLIVKDLSPKNLGRLLSFYEAKTIFESFIWDINPFDQFGVELGKKIAAGIRDDLIEKNKSSQIGALPVDL